MPGPRGHGRPALASLRSQLPGWVPARGLRDEDWAGRHRLLSWLLILTAPALTGFGLCDGSLGTAWLLSVSMIGLCSAGAIVLSGRVLPSMCVALGLTAASAGLVAVCHGCLEAHFAFFVAVAALALYRDWAPFGVFLVATVTHHFLFGQIYPQYIFGNPAAVQHPLRWALIHGLAVLASASMQVVGWRLTEREEARADADLSQSRAQFEVSFDETPVPMIMLSPGGRLTRVNSAYRRWLEIPEIPPEGLWLPDLPITPIDPEEVPMMDQLLAGTATEAPIERTYRHDDGRILHVEVHGSPVRDRAGQIRLVVAHCMDVTEKRRHEAELRRKVREDSLTGLLSRAAFESDLLALLHDADREVCVIYIDVDRFKTVNDSYGHGVGDEVLRSLSARLQEIAPPGSLLARLGGDEFAVAVPGHPGEGERVGQAIVASCESPFKVAGGYLQVTVSVGLSIAESADQAEQAVISADAAMYAAKQTGRDQLMMFNDEMRLDTGRRVAGELLLREALDGDRSQTMPVWFQPIVALDTRRVVGAEALVRLQTMDGDVVAPGVFVPVAEETGLVVQVGEHVLRTAVGHLCRWGDRISYVSVNVSPRQLSESGFLPMLTSILEHCGLEDRSKLVLEITETSLLSTSVDLTELLGAIKALGVRLALDDFGTGYSSLTWLKSVPADIVKLDRSFVAGLSRDADKASIISAVLWLATSLGMSVVAEGVEDVEDWIALERARCPAAQGFLFSRPVTPEDLERLMTLTDPSSIRPVVLPKPRLASTPGDGPVSAPTILSSADPALKEAIEFDRARRLGLVSGNDPAEAGEPRPGGL